MRLHLPSGLRKALLSCLAALAVVLPSTLSSASLSAGALAALALAQQRAEARGTASTHTSGDGERNYAGYIIDIRRASSGQFHESTFHEEGTTGAQEESFGGRTRSYINTDGNHVEEGNQEYWLNTFTNVDRGVNGSTYGHTLRLGKENFGDIEDKTYTYMFGPFLLGGLIVEAHEGVTYTISGDSNSDRTIILESGAADVDVRFTIGSNMTFGCGSYSKDVNVNSNTTFEVARGKTLSWGSSGQGYALNVADNKTLTIQKFGEGEGRGTVSARLLKLGGGGAKAVLGDDVEVIFGGIVTEGDNPAGTLEMGSSTLTLGGAATLSALEIGDSKTASIVLQNADASLSISSIRATEGSTTGGNLTISGTGESRPFTFRETTLAGGTLTLGAGFTYGGELRIQIGGGGESVGGHLGKDSEWNALGSLRITITGLGDVEENWSYQLITGDNVNLTEEAQASLNRRFSTDGTDPSLRCSINASGVITFQEMGLTWQGGAGAVWKADGGSDVWEKEVDGTQQTVPFVTESDVTFETISGVSKQDVPVSGRVSVRSIFVGQADSGNGVQNGVFYTFNPHNGEEGATVDFWGDIILAGTYGDEASPSKAVFNTDIIFSGWGQTIKGGEVEFGGDVKASTDSVVVAGDARVVFSPGEGKRVNLTTGVIVAEGGAAVVDATSAKYETSEDGADITDTFTFAGGFSLVEGSELVIDGTTAEGGKTTVESGLFSADSGKINGSATASAPGHGTLTLRNVDLTAEGTKALLSDLLCEASSSPSAFKVIDELRVEAASVTVGDAETTAGFTSTGSVAIGAGGSLIIQMEEPQEQEPLVQASSDQDSPVQEPPAPAPGPFNQEQAPTISLENDGTLATYDWNDGKNHQVEVSARITLSGENGSSAFIKSGGDAADDKSTTLTLTGEMDMEGKTVKKTGMGVLALGGTIHADENSKFDIQEGTLSLLSAFDGTLSLRNGATLTLNTGVAANVELNNGANGATSTLNAAGGTVRSLSLKDGEAAGELTLAGEGALTFAKEDGSAVELAAGTSLVLGGGVAYAGELSIAVEGEGATENGSVKLKVGEGLTGLNTLRIDLAGLSEATPESWEGYELFASAGDTSPLNLNEELRTALERNLKSDALRRYRLKLAADGAITLVEVSALTWNGGAGATWTTSGGGEVWSSGEDAQPVAFAAESDVLFTALDGNATQTVTVSGSVSVRDIFFGAENGVAENAGGEEVEVQNGVFYTFNPSAGGAAKVDFWGDMIFAGTYGDEASPSKAVFNTDVTLSGWGQTIGGGEVEFQGNVKAGNDRVTVAGNTTVTFSPGEGMSVDFRGGLTVAATGAVVVDVTSGHGTYDFGDGFTLASNAELVIDGTTVEGGKTNSVDGETISRGKINSGAAPGNRGYGTLVLRGVDIGGESAEAFLVNLLCDAGTGATAYKIIEGLRLEASSVSVETATMTSVLTSIGAITIGEGSTLTIQDTSAFNKNYSPTISMENGSTLSTHDWDDGAVHNMTVSKQVTLSGEGESAFVIKSGGDASNDGNTTLTLSGGMSMAGKTVRKTGMGVLVVSGAINADADSKFDVQKGTLSLSSAFGGTVSLQNAAALTLGTGGAAKIELGGATATVNAAGGTVRSLSLKEGVTSTELTLTGAGALTFEGEDGGAVELSEGMTLALGNSDTYTGELGIAVAGEGATANGSVRLKVGEELTGIGVLITLTGLSGEIPEDWKGYDLFELPDGYQLSESQMAALERSLNSDYEDHDYRLKTDEKGHVFLTKEVIALSWKGEEGAQWKESDGGNVWTDRETAEDAAYRSNADVIFPRLEGASAPHVSVSGVVHARDVYVGAEDEGDVRNGASYTFNGVEGTGSSVDIFGNIVLAGTHGAAGMETSATFNVPVTFTGSDVNVTGAGTVEFAGGGFSGTGLKIGEGVTVVVSDRESQKNLKKGIVLGKGATLTLDLGVAGEGGTTTRGTVDNNYANTWNLANKVTGEQSGDTWTGSLVLANIDGYWKTTPNGSTIAQALLNFLNNKILPNSGKIGALVLRNSTLSTYTSANQGVLAKVGKIVVESGSMFWLGVDSALSGVNSPALELHATEVGGSQDDITSALQVFENLNNATIRNAVTIVGDEGVRNGVVQIETAGANNNVTLAGAVTMDPSVTLRKTGPGRLTITGTITAESGTTIDLQAGGLTLGSIFAGKVRVGEGLTMTLNAGGETGLELAGGSATLNGTGGTVHSISKAGEGSSTLTLAGSGTLTFAGENGGAVAVGDGITLSLTGAVACAGELQIGTGENGAKLSSTNWTDTRLGSMKITLTGLTNAGVGWGGYQLFTGEGINLSEALRTALAKHLRTDATNRNLRCTVDANGRVSFVQQAELTWNGGNNGTWVETGGQQVWNNGSGNVVFVSDSDVVFTAQGQGGATKTVIVSGAVHARDFYVGRENGFQAGRDVLNGAFYTFNSGDAEGTTVDFWGDLVLAGTYTSGGEELTSKVVFNTSVQLSGEATQTITGGEVEFREGVSAARGINVKGSKVVVRVEKGETEEQNVAGAFGGGISLDEGSTFVVDGTTSEGVKGAVTASLITGKINGGATAEKRGHGVLVMKSIQEDGVSTAMMNLLGNILDGTGNQDATSRRVDVLKLEDTVLEIGAGAYRRVFTAFDKLVVDEQSRIRVGAPAPMVYISALEFYGADDHVSLTNWNAAGNYAFTLGCDTTLKGDSAVGIEALAAITLSGNLIMEGSDAEQNNGSIRKTGDGMLTISGDITAGEDAEIDLQAGGLTLNSVFDGTVRIGEGLTFTLNEGAATAIELAGAQTTLNGTGGTVYSFSRSGSGERELALTGSGVLTFAGKTGGGAVALGDGINLVLGSEGSYSGELELDARTEAGWGKRLLLGEGMNVPEALGDLTIDILVNFENDGTTVADQLRLNDGLGVQIFGGAIQDEEVRQDLVKQLRLIGQDGVTLDPSLHLVISSDGVVCLARNEKAELLWQGGEDAVWKTRGATRWTNQKPSDDIFVEEDHVTFAAIEGQSGTITVPVDGRVEPTSVTVRGASYAFTPYDEGGSIVTETFSLLEGAEAELGVPTTIGTLAAGDGEGHLIIDTEGAGAVTIKDGKNFSGRITLEKSNELVMDGTWTPRTRVEIGNTSRVTLQGDKGELGVVGLVPGTDTGSVFLKPGAKWKFGLSVLRGQEMIIGGSKEEESGEVTFTRDGEISGGTLGLNAGIYRGDLTLTMTGAEAKSGVKIRLGDKVEIGRGDLTLWFAVADAEAVDKVTDGWTYLLFSKMNESDFKTLKAHLNLEAASPEILREKGARFSLREDGCVVVERTRARYWDGEGGSLQWGGDTAPWTDGETQRGIMWDNGLTVHEVHFTAGDGEYDVNLVDPELEAEDLFIEGSAKSYTFSGNSTLTLEKILYGEGTTTDLLVGSDSAEEGETTTLTVIGTATVGGSLTVKNRGVVSFGTYSTVEKNITVQAGGKFTAEKGLTVGEDLAVQGEASLADAVVNGDVSVRQGGKLASAGTLEVSGDVSVERGAALTSNAALAAAELEVEGNVTLNAGGNVFGETSLEAGGSLKTGGELSIGRMNADGGSLEVMEDGKLTIGGWIGSLKTLTLNNGAALAINQMPWETEEEKVLGLGMVSLSGRSDLTFAALQNTTDGLKLKADGWKGEGNLVVHLLENFLFEVASDDEHERTYQLFDVEEEGLWNVRIADEAGYKITFDKSRGTITVKEILPDVDPDRVYVSSEDNGGHVGTDWKKRNEDDNIYFDVAYYGAIEIDHDTTIDLTGEQRPVHAFGETGLVMHNVFGNDSRVTLSVKGDEQNDIVTLQNWESKEQSVYRGKLLVENAKLRIDHGRRDEEGNFNPVTAATVTSKMMGKLDLSRGLGLEMVRGVLELNANENDLGSNGVLFRRNLEAQLLLRGGSTSVAGELRIDSEEAGTTPEGRAEHIALRDGARLTLGAVSKDDETPAPETVVRGGMVIGNATGETEPGAEEVFAQGRVTIEQDARVTGVHLSLGSDAELSWMNDSSAALAEQDVIYGLSAAGARVRGDKEFGIRVALKDHVSSGTDFSEYTGKMTILESENTQKFVGVTSGSGWNMDVESGGRVEFDVLDGDGRNVTLQMGNLTLKSGAMLTLKFAMEGEGSPMLRADAPEGVAGAPADVVVSLQTLNVEDGAKLILSPTSFFSPTESSYRLGTVDNVTLSALGETNEITPEISGAKFWHVGDAKLRLEGNDLLLVVTPNDRNKILEKLRPDASPNARAGAEAVWDVTASQNERIKRDLSDPNSDLARLADDTDLRMISSDAKGLEKLMASAIGSSFVGVAPAFGQDMHRQLSAIRNRTASMGTEVGLVDDADDLPLWHAWINAESGYHELDDDGFQPGYRLNGWGGTVGMDADISFKTTVGLALSAMYNDLKSGAADSMTSDLDTYYLSAFLRRMSGRWSHTLVLSVGMATLDSERTVALTGGSYTAKGDTDGYALGALYEFGYTHGGNPERAGALQSVFNVEFRHVSLGGFDEGGTSAALHVDDMEQTVVTFGAGLRYQRFVGTKAVNRSALFELRALAKVDAGDTRGEVVTNFLDAAYKARLRGAEIGRVGAEVGAGVTVPVSKRGSVFVDGSVELRSGYTSFDASAGYRINF